MPRASRGGLSPIQLTTSLKPRTAAYIIRSAGIDIQQLDNKAPASLDLRARELALLLQKHWDLANLSRRHVSQRNRDRTSTAAIPNIATGDHVLYAVHKPDTKLDYTWRGPGVVTNMKNPLICTVEPRTGHPSKQFDAHITRVGRSPDRT